MDAKLIVAIIRREKLEEVEASLQAIGAERINVSKGIRCHRIALRDCRDTRLP